MFDDERSAELQVLKSPSRLSGRAVVIGMLLFGFTATGVLFVYWTLHTGPFRPLQDALAVEFPGSRPRVDGGQRKMHKGTPRILRAVLKVDFDPVQETAKGENVLDRVEKVAARYVDLSTYEILQVYLYHGIPEKDLIEKEYERNLRSISPKS